MTSKAEALSIPDSKLARAITWYIRDNETGFPFNHSILVYHQVALAGVHRDLMFDRERLYAGAMFHDIDLMSSHVSKNERFEVDDAHAARRGIPEADVSTRGGQRSRSTPRLACRSTASKFKEDIIQAFCDGIKHKPNTTFGNVKAEVIADKDPHCHRSNFCSVIRRSA